MFQTNIDVAKLDDGVLSFHTVANDAPAIGALLGGFMEVVRLPEQNAFDGLIVLADEDGLRKYNTLNYDASALARFAIVGPVLIVRASGADFVSLTGEDKAYLTNHLLGRLRLPF